MINEDLEVINKSLKALRDHFEAQGKTFVLAWYLSEKDDPERHKMRYNFLSTTASSYDLMCACTRWAGLAIEHIDKRADEQWNTNQP